MKKNLLLVEYDIQTIEKIKDILLSPVFDISIAEAGDSAKKLLKKQKFDLMITAAMLPRFHGFDLAKFVSTNYPKTKIIVMSSVYKGSEYKSQAISEFGADSFIEKPLDDKKFEDLVYSLLNITKEDIQKELDSGNTQIPTSDTKKIKVVEEEKKGKLTSNDIFGDIIDKVEKDPIVSIELNDEDSESGNSEQKKQDAGATQVLDKNYLLGKTNIETDSRKTYKEKEIDFNALIEPGEPVKSSAKNIDIENDISKKLEDTLSGLGLSSNGAAPATGLPKQSSSTAPAAPEVEKKSDEIEGYEILDMIARGGMAEIYKAKKRGAKGFEKVIVIKKILSGYGEDNKYIEMFVDEAKIAAELSHPNIVQIYDFGKKDNYYFIAMEYVEGKDLRLILNKLIEKNTLFEEHLSIYLIIKTLEALSYAHSAKDSKGKSLDIVHRDISPPNILISYTGEVKLTDFGVSKASNKSHQTLSGALKGKLLYMSSEQAKAEKNIDNRSDIYSVGVILFELLTGQKMFSGTSEMEVLNSVQEGKIIKPTEINPDIDPDLENIILKAVSKNKEDRYRNATEMITALENYLYINYNHVSTPVHLQHKIYDLFKNEILKAGIIINIKPAPFEIEKIVPPATVESIEESGGEDIKIEKDKPEDVIELKEDSEVASPVTSSSFAEGQPEPPFPDELEEKSKKPTPVEIELDDSTNIAESEFEELIITDSRLDDKKRTRPVFKVLLLITLSVFIVYYFFLRENGLFSPSGDEIGKEDSIVKNDPLKKQKSPVINTHTKSDPEKISDPDSNLLLTDNSEINNGDKDPLKKEQEKDKDPQQDLQKQQELQMKKDEETKKREALKEKRRLRKIETEKRRKIAADEKKRKDEEEKNRIAEENEKKRLEEERVKKAKEEEKRKELELKKKREEEEKNRIKPGQIVSLSEVDLKPEVISNPPPKLSRSLKMKMRQGVIVMALIDHFGNVEKIRILKKSSNKRIDSIITETILSWKYKPAEKDGVKVKVWKTINLQ